MRYKTLTDEQVEHFLRRGHIVLRDCFPREQAEQWAELAFKRLGYDRYNPATWQEKRIHMPNYNSVEVKQFAPQVWDAVCDLLGGEERVHQPYEWRDGFILNLGIGAEEPWQPPSAQSKGWHKDGDFFRHFLDSPEQGLLTIVLWSDIEPRGGGTFIACDSVGPMARFLAQHPEGVLPLDFRQAYEDILAECTDFAEMTGKIGDVVLLHPYILHAASQNHLGIARLITNPPATLREPMNFNRADPADFSPIELAVLRGLGVERYDFQRTGERERIVPERVKRQQKVIEEQQARLAAAG